MNHLFAPTDLKRHGIVHTPPWIARMMVALTISGKERLILDPACGAGVFIQALLDHPRIKNPFIIGIEKDPAVADIARQRFRSLTKNDHQPRKGPRIRIETSDFFKFIIQNENNILGKTDLIIGNPPYVRQELIPNKHRLTTILEELSDSSLKIDKKSDLYLYFLHASLELLSERGKLCFIIPDKWMSARYGASMKKRLLSLSGSITIILLRKSIFSSIDVRPLILLVEKNHHPKATRNARSTIRVLSRFHDYLQEKIITIMKKSALDKDWSITVKRLIQEHCKDITRNKSNYLSRKNWLTVIRGPQFFLRILEHRHTIPLHNNVVTEVHYGNKTGANEFFFLSTDTIARWQIPFKFLKPAVKSVKGIQGTTLTKPDSWVLHVPRDINFHELLAHDGLARYLEWGMSGPRRFQRRPSCYKSRNPAFLHDKCKSCPITSVNESCSGCRWFSLPLKKPPEFLLAKVNHVNVLPVYNAIEAHPSDSIQCIHLLNHSQLPFIYAYLHSRMVQLAMELMGRWEGGGALTLMLEDARALPLLNPLTIPSDQKETIVRIGMEMITEGTTMLSARERAELQDELDLHVLKAWEQPPETLEKLKKMIKLLQKERLGINEST